MSPVVDVHAHVLIPELERLVADEPFVAAYREQVAAGQDGHTRRVNTALANGQWGRDLTDPAARLATMDRMGVDVQVLSIAGNQYHYGAPAELARELVELANDRLAATAAARPDRLLAMATVALQFPELAAEQLVRATAVHGMRAVAVSSWAGGRDFSHPAYAPFWDAAERTGALVFVHPLGCSLGGRLRPAYLGNIVGQPVETTVALSHLIFGGVLDRHPRLRLCAAHGGGYLPHYIGRSDHAYAVRPDSRTPAEPPSHYLGRIYYDTVVHGASTLRQLIAAVGADRVLLGSDYPYDMGSVDPLAELAATGLREPERAAIAGANAATLLSLSPSPARRHPW
jgi:aminocarboxymuconate-semialdehyde decarboxylase